MITSISNTSMVSFARMPQQHGHDCVPHWHMHERAHLNKMGRSIKDGVAGKCPLLHGQERLQPELSWQAAGIWAAAMPRWTS